MGDLNLIVDIHAIENLQMDLKKAIDLYPDKAAQTLETLGKQFKKRVATITKQNVKKRTGNLLKGYKLDPIEGYGIYMSKNFRATSPHFHLIEKGHEIIGNGKRGRLGKHLGWVPGKLMVNQAREEFCSVLPIQAEQMRDDILRRSGLL